MRRLLESDTGKTIKEMPEQLGMHYSTVPHQMHKLGTVKKLYKLIPDELAE